MAVPYQTSSELKHPHIAHGFFGREGGVSTGVFASLNINLHKGDDEQNIAQNRKIICDAMGIQHLVTLRQVHKNDVLVVDEHTENGHQMDALVTKTPGRLLAIQTADCAPILLADPIAKVVGAVHAGWRSAVTGIVETTLDAMKKLGANLENISAVIGPCIQQKSFEVGKEVVEQANAPEFFRLSIRPDHYLFDLSGYLLMHLNAQGVSRTTALPIDTYTLEDHYFSYRRHCHKKEPSCGGQLSVIGLLE